MENVVLEFNKRKVEKLEMKQHIEYYLNMAEEGMCLYSNGNLKEAMSILKDIRKKLKLEYNYYEKETIKKYIRENEYYRIYYTGICDAYVKQMIPNTYATLHSNLYDVYDYVSHYGMEIFIEDNN